MKPVVFGMVVSALICSQAAEWKAGFASVKITPEKPVPLAGYAARTNAFKEVDMDLEAKALALEDSDGNRAVLITADICTLSPTVAEPIREEVARKTGIRLEQVLLNLSHTHSGPWVTLAPRSHSAELNSNVVEYTRLFQARLIQAGAEAVSRLAPAKLSHGSGVANFAMNRREFTARGVILGVNPRGLVDRSVPVLRIDSPEGELRGVLFGYACHGTTLPSDSLLVSGDYPAYARAEIQGRFPKAEALFMAGLGGSANPYPRTGLELARNHGQELGREVLRVLETRLRPIQGPLTCVMETAELPLRVLSRAELAEASNPGGPSWMRGAAREMLAKLDAGEPFPRTHRAPVAVWQFGADLTLVALSGEVVIEYVPLIERAIGPLNLWLAAYCNAVSGYVPARATLNEGGYECRGLYEGTGFYAPETEDVLVRTVIRLAQRAGRAR